MAIVICRYKNLDKWVFHSVYFIFISHWKWSKNSRKSTLTNFIISDFVFCVFVYFFFRCQKSTAAKAYCSKFQYCIDGISTLNLWFIFFAKIFLLSLKWQNKSMKYKKKYMVDKYQNATFIVIITIRLYYSMYPYKWRKTKSKITIKKITCSVIKLAKKRARER